MKKIIIALIVIFIVGITFIVIFLKKVDKALTPDPDYNTVMTENYNESVFQNLPEQISKKEIFQLLGYSFKTVKPEFMHKVLYSKNQVEIDFGTGVTINDTTIYVKFLVFDFDTIGNVIKVWNKNFLMEEEAESLESMVYKDIISELGKPLQEVYCDCKCSILYYSKLKEGPYTGKHPIINIKRIVLDESEKLIKKIDGVGNPYDEYFGICNE